MSRNIVRDALHGIPLAGRTLIANRVHLRKGDSAPKGLSEPRKVESNPGKHESCPIGARFHEDVRVVIRQVTRL